MLHSHSLSRSLGVVVILMVLSTLLPIALVAQAETPRPRYTIDASLDYEAARLTAEQTVAVPNTTGQPLAALVFQVTPAYFGAFQLDQATVDGKVVTARQDGSVVELPLASALEPGATANVSIDFAIVVPRPGYFRLGAGQGIIALGNWYPVLAVWQGSDWDRHQYTGVGDAFSTDVADYDVTLRTAPNVAVAHSGDLVSRDGGTWRLRAERVRDFAMTVSHRYERQETVVDGITLIAYALPEHRQAASEYLATGAPLLRWANANLSRYPYSTLTIGEAYSEDPVGVGQEYPGLVFVSTNATATGAGRGGYLSYLVAHELIHQWFYGIVGSDQIDEPWVDEAFATYLSYRFFADEFPPVFPAAWQSVLDRYESERAWVGDHPVNSSIYDFSNDARYFPVVYRRGAIFLEELRGTIGDERFRRLLKEFVSRNQFQTPRGTDFLDLAQAQTTTDLKPLFRKYFSYGKYDPSRLDYSISNGWYFRQANGRGGDGDTGYAVTDDGGIRFWSEFQRLGGVATFGYPASRRFEWDGFTVQVFQKAVFQWRPEVGRVYFVNVLDRLSMAGHDEWLLAFRQTPRPLDNAADTDLSWDRVVERHVAMLDDHPAIREKYFAAPNWLDLYGLPVSTADYENVVVVRFQRAAFQQWKVAVPWAQAGEVTVANGGDLAKEAGILPAEALVPQTSDEY